MNRGVGRGGSGRRKERKKKHGRRHEAEFQTERWQQLVGREFGGKNESKHDDGEHAEQYITFFY